MKFKYTKDDKIKDLQVKIIQLEGTIDGLKRTLSEKDEVINKIKFKLDNLINCVNDAIKETKDL
ncbi:hypothetical protein ES703_31357 [subsurface metagenome]